MRALAAALLALMPMADAAAAEPATLAGHVEFLATLDPPRNFDHPGSLDRAAAYIEEQLERAGWTTREQPFEVRGNTYRNIVARRGPADAPRVIVGAHYDVHGDLPGADDNASGVAVLIELARMLADYEPAVGLELVAFTLEEQPAFSLGAMGSAHHADQLVAAGVEVRAMLALEMLGYFRDLPGTQRFPVPVLGWWYPTTGNFVGLIGRWRDRPLMQQVQAGMRAGGDVPVHYLASPLDFPGLDNSDHRNYWPHGWPAAMVTDTAYYRNPNYHTRFDIPGTLDYQRMAALVPALAAAVRSLTQTEDASPP
ncbi:M28 family peptidase [Spectribacter hydrogenooxidans]|uniref:M28 family peptidase n=1 Tax=Spectribacter hydrogenoxidans TaxID=3075608 RepID=A0ABU3BYM4_9GAMM|nr:M28 family peptidase [Salinisphaera sp. W335]MDT0634221.1 M28 family peptidase [Salinisphaera sp. W335]